MFVKENGYYYIEEFREFGVEALFTDKDSGNMAVEVLNEEETVRKNRRELLKKYGRTEADVFISKQIHEDKIYVAGESEKGCELEGYDAFITKNKRAVLMTKYADCLPVFFYDKIGGVIAVAHSGWKGSLSGIAVKTAARMKKEFGTDMNNVIAGIGIEISIVTGKQIGRAHV